jgi:WhiB family redox-sensing transcriptional regulator
MTAVLPEAPDTPMLLLAPSWPRRWQDDALCAQTDPEIFFPERGAAAKAAMAVCRACPVRAECLAYALEHEAVCGWGVWGGVSERGRRKLKRQMRRAS